MEAMSSCDVLSFSNKDTISSAVITILQKNGMTNLTERLITLQPAPKKNTSRLSTRVFGLPLEGTISAGQQQDRKMTECDGRPCYLPRFFVESVEFLRKHVKTEGLFRKAGSLNRQKGLRAAIEEGSYIPLSSSNPHDVAALLKQYLRELPEPLVTKRLAPLYLECTTLFNEETSSTDSSSLTKSQGILMLSLLLPTQHLICLKILMRLLHEVVLHRKESLMDSRGLAVVIAPNLFPQPTDDKKAKKGGGGGSSTADAKLGIKDMTWIVSTLIDHTHLIGAVPPTVQQLSQEFHQNELETNYNKKKKKHKRHETVSLLLRETFSKIKGGPKRQEFPSGTLSGDDLLNSPDGLGPGASKRVALNESSDMSSDKSASATPSPSSSGRIRKKLFTRKTKRQYSILRGKGQEGGKFEKVPLLSCQQSQDDLFPGIPSSPLLQTHTPTCDLVSLPTCVSPIPKPLSFDTSSTHVALSSPITVHLSPLVVEPSPLRVEPSPLIGKPSTAVLTGTCSSNYKLVSKTRKTYQKPRPVAAASTAVHKPVATIVHKPVKTPTITTTTAATANTCSNSTSRIPLKTDHSIRKRKASELPRSKSSLASNNTKTPSLPISHSEFTLSSNNCPSHVTASTPVGERPKRMASTSGHRKITSYQPKFNTDVKPSTISSKMANNDSYLHAVDGNHCKLTPCRKVLHEIGNESPALCTPDGKSATKSTTAASQERRRRRSKSMRVGSHTTAPHTPVVASVNKSGKSQNSIVKSQSMSRRGITTARSPWINRRGIQISEWDI